MIEKEFRFRCVGRIKGKFDIDGNIVKWTAFRLGNGEQSITFLGLYGDSISCTGFKSHPGYYDLDKYVGLNEHHTHIYQVVHLYYDKKLHKAEREKMKKLGVYVGEPRTYEIKPKQETSQLSLF